MAWQQPAEWIYILKDAELVWRRTDIDIFIEMWNADLPIGYMADKLGVKKRDIALLVMHCEIEGQIEARPGGLWGSVKKKRREDWR